MARSDGIGYNVASFRQAAGLTQEQLAERVGVAGPYISMIENGRRPVNSRDLLDRLAKGLGIEPWKLTGQPYPATDRTDFEQYQVIPRIRIALSEPDDGPIAPRPIEQLELLTDQAMAARMNCDVRALGRTLPDVLAETRILWHEDGNRTAGELFVKAAVTGALAVKAAGWIDLGAHLADQADRVARAHGDPVSIAAAQFAVAQCWLTIGSRRLSARIATAGADQVAEITRSGKLPPKMLNDLRAWSGMLHLHAALATAGLQGGDPDGHLAAADAICRTVVGNPWRMEATNANRETWAIAIALDKGEPDLAIQLARRVDANALLSPQRKARRLLDTGHAEFLTGNYDEAVRYLLLAEQAAPGDLRQRPTAVEMASHLVRNATGRGSSELRNLAVAAGITPAAA